MPDETLCLTVNGKNREFAATNPCSLDQVVVLLELRPDRVAIEHNGEIVPRSLWHATPIASNDRLEVVHFVGGGIL
ncbi:MAG: sulfur carrier protein ThiS [Acidobacteriaceae bacterium]|nr:sulfur carrier protein ThiS [Acidobacteriaceae bacterium]